MTQSALPPLRDERMDAVDVTWLRMDRPANLMVITGVMILDGPVDVDRVQRTLAARILKFERFRQRIEVRTGSYWWCADPHFDVARHVRRVRLPGAGDKAELQRYVAELAGRPLDRSHPLWEFLVVEQYEGGAVVVARIHHAIADGIALVRVLLSLTDDRADAPLQGLRHHPLVHPVDEAPAPWEELLGGAGHLVDQSLRVTDEAWRAAMGIVSRPGRAVELLRQATGVAGELAWLLLMPTDTATRMKGIPSGDKRVAWAEPIALPEVKAVSRALGCSVNDMLLSAVAGALRAYLEDKGDPTEGVEFRALVPINLRPANESEGLGNRFGIIAVELPVGIASPLESLYEVRHRMEELKRSYEPAVTLGLFGALGHAPQVAQDRLFDLLLSRASAVMTNVPGPRQPLFLGGAPMRQLMFWVPQSGNIGMGVSILSFNGQVHFGLITDAALVPDPEQIIRRFAPEFERLLYHVLMNPWGDGTPPQPARPARPRRRTPAKARKAPARAAPRRAAR
jgi:diacylglycerol O-acyltransferase